MELIAQKDIESRIISIGDLQVMLDRDLAVFFQTETRTLKQTVNRNIDRFPFDFMIELTDATMELLVSQSVIPSKSYFGGSFPFAFTEQGIAMLSSILKSNKAIEINISIIRAFVTFRQFTLTYNELKTKIEEIESQFPEIYSTLNYLVDKDNVAIAKDERTKIGYKT